MALCCQSHTTLPSLPCASIHICLVPNTLDIYRRLQPSISDLANQSLMKKVPIAAPKDFKVRPQILSSFAGQPEFFRLMGPGGLVRFVQDARMNRDGIQLQPSRTAGDCWFDERVFSGLRERAKAELHGQLRGRKPSAPFRSLVGLYMRLCLRDDLAVSKDWNEFDRYVVLPLRPQDEIVALVGEVKQQPVYSVGHPDHLPAEMAKIRLPGGADQFILDFSYPANMNAEKRLLGPFAF
jgi:hypothetical protein